MTKIIELKDQTLEVDHCTGCPLYDNEYVDCMLLYFLCRPFGEENGWKGFTYDESSPDYFNKDATIYKDCKLKEKKT